jgi:two-component system cell cycle response regulator
MSADENEKTSVVSSETFKIRMSEAKNAPPALILLMGPPNLIGKQWSIEKSEYVIGRSPECQIFVEDRSVSKKHAQVKLVGTEVFISDLGSTNGTEVANEVITGDKKRKLANNEQIKIGSVIFKFLEQGNIETVSARSTFDKTQIDPLTQIFNKGALLVQGAEVFKRATVAQMALSVIVFDLDNFKKLNDTYGHQAGDYVLREMSDMATNKLIRKGDFFARFGGEEFCLILLGSNLQKGVEVAERIRATIATHPFEYKGQKLSVTVSAGVACLEGAMQSWAELFEKADQASYVSKKNGKNKVSTI